MRRAWFVLGVVVAAGVWVDQYTKGLAQTYLRGRPFMTVVEGFVELRYTLNRGAFFSLGADLPHAYRAPLLSALAAVTLVLVLVLFRRTTAAQLRLRVALGLLWAGGAGNLIDRLKRGEVIDFIHVHVRDAFHWATFNVADVYLTFGIALLILDLLRPQTAPSAPPLASETP